MVKKYNHKILDIVYYLEIACITIFMVMLCFGDATWYDEIFSISIVEHSFADIISFTASDVHPPLYYFVLKIFELLFGYHMAVYRLVSVLFFFIMLCTIGWFCKKYFGIEQAILAVLFTTSAPNMLLYAVEMRMYSLCCMLVVFSFILAIELYNQANWKKWILFSIVNVLAAYTHYFAGAAVILIMSCLFLFMVLRNENRKNNVISWFLSTGLTVIIYLPWLFVFYQQLTKVKGDYWIEPFQLSYLKDYAKFIFGESRMLGIVLILAFFVAFFMIFYFKNKQNYTYVFFIETITFFGFILLGILLSILVTPVFWKRYIVIVLPLFWMMVTCSILQLENRKLFVVLGCIGWIMFYSSYSNEYYHRNAEVNSTAYYLMQEEMNEGDAIYTEAPFILAAMSVYFDAEDCYVAEDSFVGEAFGRWQEMIGCNVVKDAQAFCDKKIDTVWLLDWGDESRVSVFEENGYEVIDMGVQTVGWGDGADCMYFQVYLAVIQ